VALTIAGNGTPGNSSSQLSHPRQIAVDSSGKLYIYDTGNKRIQIVNDGSVHTWRPLNGSLSGTCLFIDDHGTLYIENGANKSIMRWTHDNVLAESQCRSSEWANMFVFCE
jgi:streptogramin lyase